MICIAIFFVILRFDGLFSSFQKILQSLQAIVVGLIVAYLLNPIVKWFERFLYKRSRQKSKELTHKQCQKIRAASVAFAMAIFLAIIVVLIWLIIPQLVVCIEDIVLSMNEKVQNLTEWVDRLTKQNSAISVSYTHLASSTTSVVIPSSSKQRYSSYGRSVIISASFLLCRFTIVSSLARSHCSGAFVALAR